MGTKQIRVSEDSHAYLKNKQREGESLGDTAERLSRDFSLHEWATEGWDDIDDEDRREVAETPEEIDDEELPT